MVDLTATQLLNLCGYINFRTNFIINKINEARANPERAAAIKAEVRPAVEELAKLMRTFVIRQGYTPPNTEFNDQDLAGKGIS